MLYKVEQKIQKHKMSRMLEQENSRLLHLTISMDEFENSKKSDKEILLDGKLYDLKSYSILGNTVKLYAIHDKAEELINKALKNAMKTTSQEDNGLLVKIVKLLSLDYTYPFSFPQSVKWHPLLIIIPLLNDIIYSWIADILTPPPEVG